MKRAIGVLGATAIGLAVIGCGSSEDGSVQSSAATSQTPTVTQAAPTAYTSAPTALTLGAVLEHRGFVCTDRRASTSTTAEYKAMCRTGPNNGGGTFVTLETYPSEAAMRSALRIKQGAQQLSKGIGRFSLAYAGNWIIECPGGGPGGEGSVSCAAARDALGGTFDE